MSYKDVPFNWIATSVLLALKQQKTPHFGGIIEQNYKIELKEP